MRYKCSMRRRHRKTPRAALSRPGLALILALLASGLAQRTSWAGGVSTPWPPGVKSRTTLVSSGAPVNGRYRAGLDIALAPGVLTYWRTPGDAGVPPVFNFAGSQNVASVSVAYPAPTRIVEAGVTTYGYTGEVLYPLDVRAKDPSLPSVLNVDLHFATCDTLCVPAEAHETLRLSPTASPTADGAWIARWASRVPQPLPAGRAPRIKPLKAGAKPIWRASFPDSAGSGTDLFAEGPHGWYFDTKPEGSGHFDIILAEKPAGQDFPVAPVTLTFVDGSHAYDARVSLDEAPAER